MIDTDDPGFTIDDVRDYLRSQEETLTVIIRRHDENDGEWSWGQKLRSDREVIRKARRDIFGDSA